MRIRGTVKVKQKDQNLKNWQEMIQKLTEII